MFADEAAIPASEPGPKLLAASSIGEGDERGKWRIPQALGPPRLWTLDVGHVSTSHLLPPRPVRSHPSATIWVAQCQSRTAGIPGLPR